MAQRRMFSLKIVDTDDFLDMSPTTQNLYFHLAMRADDDGFVNSPKKIMKIVNSPDDDLKVLMTKQFIIPFKSGVIVIRHWKENNYIQADRYHKTIYNEEMAMLTEDENGIYDLDTKCIQNVSKMDTQVRLELGKERKEIELGEVNTLSATADVSKNIKDSFSIFWNAYPKKELKKKTQEIWDRRKLGKNIKEILAFIEKAKQTDRWKKGYIKAPTVFLNNDAWNDDLSSYNDKGKVISYQNQNDNDIINKLKAKTL